MCRHGLGVASVVYITPVFFPGKSDGSAVESGHNFYSANACCMTEIYK